MKIEPWLTRLRYVGALLWVFGFIILSPLTIIPFSSQLSFKLSVVYPFVLPAAISMLIGGLLSRSIDFRPLSGRESLVVVSLGWITVSVIGALPLFIGLDVGFLNAVFESTSGFTTTGITVLQGLDSMPHHILFWRSLTQWIGGLGILTLFLVLVFRGDVSHKLFGAESHKIFSERPAPGLFHTLKILWSIYSLFTVVIAFVLALEGLTWFDAINHALTAPSTGGFSTHDASIDYFRQAGYANYRMIEFTFIWAMTLGGMSFVVHYRVLRGEIKALWEGLEIRLFWKIILVSLAIVALSHFVNFGVSQAWDVLRHGLFQVVALVTSTGYATKDIGSMYFPTGAKLIFLFLMVVGGCVGSTAGGFKVLRVGILGKMVTRQIRSLSLPSRAVNILIVDGEVIPVKEIRRIAALLFAWMGFLLVGSLITAYFSNLGVLASISGMFSAMGNMGPSYIPLKDWPALHPIIRITYIVGMLAGRLEILPIIMLFARIVWR
ncbi:MAG: TrkH family potassium uptake protein [Candidatus Bipolaricaulota bacterium]